MLIELNFFYVVMSLLVVKFRLGFFWVLYMWIKFIVSCSAIRLVQIRSRHCISMPSFSLNVETILVPLIICISTELCAPIVRGVWVHYGESWQLRFWCRTGILRWKKSTGWKKSLIQRLSNSLSVYMFLLVCMFFHYLWTNFVTMILCRISHLLWIKCKIGFGWCIGACSSSSIMIMAVHRSLIYSTRTSMCLSVSTLFVWLDFSSLDKKKQAM